MSTHSGGCSCGCGTVALVSKPDDPCGCECTCCHEPPATKADEIAQLKSLRNSIDARLHELRAEEHA